MRAATTLVLAGLLTLVACGSGNTKSASSPTTAGAGKAATGGLDVKNWDSVLAAAKGQTLNLYMYGGDEKINAYVTGYLKDQLAKTGVTLNQVKITDTVEAVNKVLGEKQAGKNDGGSVDVIWVNGENFKTLKQADYWYCGYLNDLPNAKYVDFTNVGLTSDFGVPIDQCESPWEHAQSVVVYDSAKVKPEDLKSPATMLAYVKAHPGSFTYPSPPDFTGSMVVRTFFYNQAGSFDGLLGPFDQAKYTPVATGLWKTLNDLEPSLWRNGATYPASESDLEGLYANGEISMFLTYGSGGVGEDVEKGTFPATTREAVFDSGMLGNFSYLGIPKNAANKAAALVLANLELSPTSMLEKLKAAKMYPAIDLAKVPNAADFAAVPTPPSVLPFAQQIKDSNPELRAEWVTALEKDWKANVQEK